MRHPTRRELRELSQDTGYRENTLEKTIRLLCILQAVADDGFLRKRLALKGGTALNAFHLNLPRLSVDIDLNYIGPLDEAAMLAERGKVEATLSRILTAQGYAFKGPKPGVVGTKWIPGFRSALGMPAELAIDLGWLERRPLFPAARMRSARLGRWRTRNVLVVSREEVVASKLAALFGRSRGRDLFDARSVMKSFGDLDWRIIRPAFYVFVAVSRTGWRDLEIGIAKARRHGEYMHLQACLPAGYFDRWRGPAAWFSESLKRCRRSFGSLDDPTDRERRFVDGVQLRGELDTGLLRAPPAVTAWADELPWLPWKCKWVLEGLEERKRQRFSVPARPREPSMGL